MSMSKDSHCVRVRAPLSWPRSVCPGLPAVPHHTADASVDTSSVPSAPWLRKGSQERLRGLSVEKTQA